MLPPVPAVVLSVVPAVVPVVVSLPLESVAAVVESVVEPEVVSDVVVSVPVPVPVSVSVLPMTSSAPPHPRVSPNIAITKGSRFTMALLVAPAFATLRRCPKRVGERTTSTASDRQDHDEPTCSVISPLRHPVADKSHPPFDRGPQLLEPGRVGTAGLVEALRLGSVAEQD